MSADSEVAPLESDLARTLVLQPNQQQQQESHDDQQQMESSTTPTQPIEPPQSARTLPTAIPAVEEQQQQDSTGDDAAAQQHTDVPADNSTYTYTPHDQAAPSQSVASHPAPPVAIMSSSASSTSVVSGTGSTASTTSHPQLVALRKIDALSEKLQKEGKLLEALQCMEKSLILRGHIFGLDSIEVFRACKSVGEMCNYLGMTFLQQDLFDVTLELLKKAEVLTERHKAVRAVTYNNLSCYYRKRGKLRTALNYCRKALGIEAKIVENVKSADTHLNMCTILSELKRHEKAIVHARIALKLLLMELFGEFNQIQIQSEQQQQQQQQPYSSSPSDPSSTSYTASTDPHPEHAHEAIAIGSSSRSNNSQSMSELRSRLPPDRVAVLAIAYHNLACQQEFLRKYSDSLLSYEKATKVVTTHLGSNHPLVASLSESYHAARKKFQNKLERSRHAASAAPTASASSKGATTTTTPGNGKQPVSRLEQHAAKSAASLHAQVQSMPDEEYAYEDEPEEPDDE